MESLISQIIAGVILFFLGIGVVALIIKILTPFLFVGFSLLAIATYPLVLLIRLSGYKKCPSLFPIWRALFGIHSHQEYESTQRKEDSQIDSSKSDKGAQRVSTKETHFDPWVVLEVPRNASKEEIKIAYKKKVVLNHPDKVASLDPALQKFATQRTVLLQKAYEQLIEAT